MAQAAHSIVARWRDVQVETEAAAGFPIPFLSADAIVVRTPTGIFWPVNDGELRALEQSLVKA